MAVFSVFFNISLAGRCCSIASVFALWCEKSDPDLYITADSRYEGMRYLILTSFLDMKTVIVSLLLTFQHVSAWFGRKVHYPQSPGVQNPKLSESSLLPRGKLWLLLLPCQCCTHLMMMMMSFTHHMKLLSKSVIEPDTLDGTSWWVWISSVDYFPGSTLRFMPAPSCLQFSLQLCCRVSCHCGNSRSIEDVV